MSDYKSKHKSRNGLKVIMMLIIATVLLIIFIVFALLLAPRDSIPEFEITDRHGSWEAQGTIAVFDDTIVPGSSGEYQFILKNASEGTLRFGIELSEYRYTSEFAEPFMQYRLKMNGINLDTNAEEWHYVNDLNYYDLKILPGTEHMMTLEWRWPFESGNDSNDTVVGRAGGELSVVFFVWAEVVYD